MRFWEHVDHRGGRPFSEWRRTLPVKDRASLDEKMRAIEAFGFSAGCFKGPLKGYKHLYKIKVRGPTQEMRPLLCKGPVDMDGEVTMLTPMIEKDWKDVPPSAKADAEILRKAVLANPTTRRVPYEVPK